MLWIQLGPWLLFKSLIGSGGGGGKSLDFKCSSSFFLEIARPVLSELLLWSGRDFVAFKFSNTHVETEGTCLGGGHSAEDLD